MRAGTVVAFLLSLCFSLVPPLHANPRITFERNVLRADGLTPRGEAICFGIAHIRAEHDYTVVRSDHVAADSDGDGAVTFTLDRPVAFHSVWAVVDLTTGEVAIATPSGFEQKLNTLSVNDLRGPADKRSGMAIRMDAAELLIVRPRIGAWRVTAYEGGAADKDKSRDGTLTVGVEQFRSVGRGGPAAPPHFAPGDVIVLIDPRRMAFQAIRVSSEGGR